MSNNLKVEASMEPVSKIDTSSVFDSQVEHTLIPEYDFTIYNFPALPFISIKATLKRKIRKDLIEYCKQQRALKKKEKEY